MTDRLIEITLMTTRRHLLASGSLIALTSAFAHTGPDPQKNPVLPKKEQKDWGIAGDAKSVKRTLVVGMSDQMRFTPDKISVKQGETIRFTAKNRGKILHEFVIGTKKELDDHAALMLKFPNMEHDEPYMMHVAPGKTAQIIWTFNRVGDFEFACLIPGHYQAGMVGQISVTTA
jgi:uncharacterized cupredoxin-like copper-binding protein